MPLPTSRDRTFLPSDPISGAFLNQMQDMLIVAYEPERVYLPFSFTNESATPGAWALSSNGRFITTTADDATVQVPLSGLPKGRTLIRADFRIGIDNSAAIDVTGQIRRAQDGGTTKSIGFSNFTSGTSGTQTLQVAGSHLIDSDFQYFAILSSGNAAGSVDWYAVNLLFA